MHSPSELCRAQLCLSCIGQLQAQAALPCAISGLCPAAPSARGVCVGLATQDMHRLSTFVLSASALPYHPHQPSPGTCLRSAMPPPLWCRMRLRQASTTRPVAQPAWCYVGWLGMLLRVLWWVHGFSATPAQVVALAALQGRLGRRYVDSKESTSKTGCLCSAPACQQCSPLLRVWLRGGV